MVSIEYFLSSVSEAESLLEQNSSLLWKVIIDMQLQTRMFIQVLWL